MQSDAKSVEEYIAALPAARHDVIAELREVILERLPDGYEEAMNWGMITYQVPLATYPDTYNGKPLMYAALASQKNHFAVYLTGIYQDEGRREEFLAAYAETGKRLDMGKSCVRFRKVEDVPFDVIGDAIAAVPVEEFVTVAEETRRGRKSKD